ncbi:Coenzyme F420 hydrogenase/dehydrogenase, beta subunit C-terminal domain [Calidifontibacillus erzurumensis]|uniref:Coenzyme F420 hydrogenase/dehydrogenase, beta subunit C-terminal domain n=1 Tax=Calidifontibacillus erzurumensis TaxID=2741433 RepID=A0A8J8GJ64_9BACI|nr:Coenzyme F420 hydrogenase/dehydrogenase, beta subunit C-terminal domain [Calidifontibacillus erzurumensis]NSL52726.1 Coenzyme F420 hydrogenase/dehydrogenase, beta subunit C-terminal domain [Calidifontibacillus erzurumensis]
MKEQLDELINTVVKNDYCIGCGICASIEGSPLAMKLDENGKYKPLMNIKDCMDEINIDFLSICPFSSHSINESELGKKLFDDYEGISFNEYTGYYLKNYAGYVKEGDFRKKGSSGGVGNWIASKLLQENLVDGIIHVKPANQKDEVLFKYQISCDNDELSKGAKSKYYPVEMSQVLKFVKENEGRYALIGIPCFIKGVRLLAEQDEIIRERIKFCIGLVCGHLKSDMFAKSIGWQLGIEPKYLKGIDFRKKLENRLASDYGVEVIGEKDGKEVILNSPTRHLYTTNWGHGLFKYNACEFCDDVLAETADITVGDAWLPEYTKDSMGTNVIIVRNPVIQQIIENNKNKLWIDEISVEKVYQSQAGGFRHRREGLAYRLYLKDQNNEWRPPKRVKSNNNLPSKRKRIYEERTKLSQESFKAFKAAEQVNNFQVFIDYMDPMIKKYNKLSAPSIVRRVLSKIKREILRRIGR